MKARVKLIEGVSFVGQTESGHAVVMDGPPDSGGKNLGPRPMEMLLLGLGGCSAFDVVHILRKARLDVRDCVALPKSTPCALKRTPKSSPKFIFTSLSAVKHWIPNG